MSGVARTILPTGPRVRRKAIAKLQALRDGIETDLRAYKDPVVKRRLRLESSRGCGLVSDRKAADEVLVAAIDAWITANQRVVRVQDRVIARISRVQFDRREPSPVIEYAHATLREYFRAGRQKA